MSPARRASLCALMLSFALPVSAAPAGTALTIYSNDLGLVRERRTVDLNSARDTVRMEDVSERLDFTSVRLVLEGAKVTRLAYRYDVVSGDRLLELARGKRVRVASRDDRVTEGTLVAVDGAWLVVRGDDGTVSTLSRTAVEDVRLSQPPADLTLRPTIEAVVESAKRGKTNGELSYLTGGLSWSAEHSLVRTGEGTGVWSAGVTIENTTGRDYRDATLKLVAGDVRRQGPMPPMPRRLEVQAMAMEEKSADLSEQSFADYHLYTLDRPATLRDRESQALTMIEPHTVKLDPRYYYRGGMSGVAAQLILMNTKAGGLGVPLPAGRVRVYEKDSGGIEQFTGEARIGHTAEGEKVTLEVGTAFDLAAERREVFNKRISDREREYQVEIKLRNRKKTGVSIVVEEGVAPDHEVLSSSHPSTRKDAGTLQFTIPVAAGKESVLTYTVRVRY